MDHDSRNIGTVATPASEPLIALIRLLARQAAREWVAEQRGADSGETANSKTEKLP
jgi:hypothetical protein